MASKWCRHCDKTLDNDLEREYEFCSRYCEDAYLKAITGSSKECIVCGSPNLRVLCDKCRAVAREAIKEKLKTCQQNMTSEKPQD